MICGRNAAKGEAKAAEIGRVDALVNVTVIADRGPFSIPARKYSIACSPVNVQTREALGAVTEDAIKNHSEERAIPPPEMTRMFLQST